MLPEIAMIYEQRITIPKNTPESAPAVETLPVHPGILKQVEVIFPAGCVGLVHLRIYYWEHQLFPANPDSSFSGDDAHLVYEEDLEIRETPLEFSVRGWNLDDTYPHTPIVRILILPFERDIRNIFSAFQLGASGPVTQVGG
jgi:hypothetical protein